MTSPPAGAPDENLGQLAAGRLRRHVTTCAMGTEVLLGAAAVSLQFPGNASASPNSDGYSVEFWSAQEALERVADAVKSVGQRDEGFSDVGIDAAKNSIIIYLAGDLTAERSPSPASPSGGQATCDRAGPACSPTWATWVPA